MVDCHIPGAICIIVEYPSVFRSHRVHLPSLRFLISYFEHSLCTSGPSLCDCAFHDTSMRRFQRLCESHIRIGTPQCLSSFVRFGILAHVVASVDGVYAIGDFEPRGDGEVEGLCDSELAAEVVRHLSEFVPFRISGKSDARIFQLCTIMKSGQSRRETSLSLCDSEIGAKVTHQFSRFVRFRIPRQVTAASSSVYAIEDFEQKCRVNSLSLCD